MFGRVFLEHVLLLILSHTDGQQPVSQHLYDYKILFLTLGSVFRDPFCSTGKKRSGMGVTCLRHGALRVIRLSYYVIYRSSPDKSRRTHRFEPHRPTSCFFLFPRNSWFHRPTPVHQVIRGSPETIGKKRKPHGPVRRPFEDHNENHVMGSTSS